MRAYKSKPWLWFTASVAVFIVIGLAARLDIKGQSIFMSSAVLAYLWNLVAGREEFLAWPFALLAAWIVSATAIGRLLHSFVIVVLSKCEPDAIRLTARTPLTPPPGGGAETAR